MGGEQGHSFFQFLRSSFSAFHENVDDSLSAIHLHVGILGSDVLHEPRDEHCRDNGSKVITMPASLTIGHVELPGNAIGWPMNVHSLGENVLVHGPFSFGLDGD